MTSICDESIGNNFCGCIGTDDPRYVQYNGNGLSSGKGAGNSCCNLISYTPDIIHRLPTSTGNTSEFGLVSKFLSLFNQLDFTPCDYTKYFGGKPVGSDADLYLKNNFPQLYDFANRQRYIYNNFYLYKASRYPSSVTNNTDLVPNISGNTISTPSGTTPLIFNYYDGVHSESQYLFIVWETGKVLPTLPFDYKIFYFYDIHGNECKNNYCTTLTSPTKGITFSSIGPGNSGGVLSGQPVTNEAVTGIFIGAVALLIIIFIGIIITYQRKEKKE